MRLLHVQPPTQPGDGSGCIARRSSPHEGGGVPVTLALTSAGFHIEQCKQAFLSLHQKFVPQFSCVVQRRQGLCGPFFSPPSAAESAIIVGRIARPVGQSSLLAFR